MYIISCTHFPSQKVFSIVVGELLTEASDFGVLLHPSNTGNCFYGIRAGWDQIVTKSRANFPSDKAVYLKIGNM